MRWYDRPDGVRLAVTEAGDPAAPAMLVAPGVGSRAELVVACFGRAVAAAGMRLVTYDPRGHGRSTPLPDPADHALARHAADLAALAVEVGAVRVGGVSLGALAALVAVEAGLAVEGVHAALVAPLGPGTVTAAANAAAADEVSRYGVPLVLARVAADPGTLPWVAAEVAASWPAHDPASLVAALRAVAAEPPVRPRVEVPVVLAAATDDPAHPYAASVDLAAALPRAEVRAVTLAAMARDPDRLGAAALGTTASGPR